MLWPKKSQILLLGLQRSYHIDINSWASKVHNHCSLFSEVGIILTCAMHQLSHLNPGWSPGGPWDSCFLVCWEKATTWNAYQPGWEKSCFHGPKPGLAPAVGVLASKPFSASRSLLQSCEPKGREMLTTTSSMNPESLLLYDGSLPLIIHKLNHGMTFDQLNICFKPWPTIMNHYSPSLSIVTLLQSQRKTIANHY